MGKLYEIHIAVSINKVLLEHSHAHSFMSSSVVAFMLKGQSWVAAMRTSWTAKLKECTMMLHRKSLLAPCLIHYIDFINWPVKE